MDPITSALADQLSPAALAMLPAPQCHTTPDGIRVWLLPNGLFHRLDGPAVEYPDGTRSWFVAGQRHRLDGPAVEAADGWREWWVDGMRHRADGPAIMPSDGTQVSYYWQGMKVRWVLPAALWREAAVREAVWAIEDPDQQRAAAQALLPTLAPELQGVTVAEALADPDAELRLWGLRAAALVAPDAQAVGSVPAGAAAGPTRSPTPRAR